MTEQRLHPNDAVKALANAAFPDYHGKTFRAVITDAPVSLDSHWDKGSRDYFVLLSADGRKIEAPQSGTPFDGPWATPPQLAPTERLIVVGHSFFCGKDHGLTFYIHPTLVPKWLPAPAENTLTPQEALVLLAALRFKSFYQGRPLRRDECAGKGVSSVEYDAALASLKARRLLNKAGAITVDDRNIANALPNRFSAF